MITKLTQKQKGDNKMRNEKVITMEFSTTSVMEFLIMATAADLKRLEESIKKVREINNK